jgi:hypothetical protein
VEGLSGPVKRAKDRTRSAGQMIADLIGYLVDTGIPLVGGLYSTMPGYRWVGKKPGESERYDE